MSRYRNQNSGVKLKSRGLILCEGETEQNYFKGLISKDEHRRLFSSISIEIYKPQNHSPLGLIKEAKRRISEAKKDKNPYDFSWIVFDKDGHAKISETFNEAKNSKPKIQIAFTVTCFEFYILLHFVKTTKSFHKCDDTVKELKKYLPDYEKATNLFKTLEAQIKAGIENSDWCLKQCKTDLENGRKPYELASYSNIHELVNFLYSLIN